MRQMKKRERTELGFNTKLSFASWHVLNQPSLLVFLSRQTFFDAGKEAVSSVVYNFYLFRDDMVCQFHFFGFYQSTWGLVIAYNCRFL